MAVNSLAIAKRLQAAERENRAAEEIALVFQELQDANLQQVATKEFVASEIAGIRSEIGKLRAEMHGEIAGVRAEIEKLRLEIRADHERLKHEMTMRMGAMLVAVVAVLGGLNVFF